jgi:hypothetical protein
MSSGAPGLLVVDISTIGGVSALAGLLVVDITTIGVPMLADLAESSAADACRNLASAPRLSHSSTAHTMSMVSENAFSPPELGLLTQPDVSF